MLGRKRRADAPIGGGAPAWLVARQARYRQKFPYSNYYDVPYMRGSPESLEAVGPSYRLATPEQRATRKDIMMTGRGLYGGKVYRGRGGLFGGLAGLLTGKGWDAGSKMGDQLWDSAGKIFSVTDKLAPSVKQFLGGGLYRGKGLLKRASGRGAYAVNNLIMDGGATASSIVPAFNPSDVHEIVYSNREYVRDIFAPASNTTFAVQSWPLNPGLADSFPWLSQMAINFEEYEIIQLAYTYKSTVADFASASGQVGQVVMATQYNPNSDSFADKEEMMLYEGGMSCKTTESLIHGIEADPKKNAGAASKYVRAGALPPTEDLKNYDLGKTSLAVLNAPSSYAGQQLGELWVSYTVKLRKPKFAAGNAYNVRRDVFVIPAIALVASQFPTSTALVQGSRNSLGCQITLATSGTNSTAPSADDLRSYLQAPPMIANPLFFTITLPPSYAGILRLRILAYNTTQAAGGGPILWATNLSPQTIFRYKDINLPYRMDVNSSTGATTLAANNAWNHILLTTRDSIVSTYGNQCDMEIHLRVQPALSGVANQIQISLTGTAATDSITFPLIEITQINSFLNVQDNGQNDRLDLVTSSGQQPYVWA